MDGESEAMQGAQEGSYSKSSQVLSSSLTPTKYLFQESKTVGSVKTNDVEQECWRWGVIRVYKA